VKKLVLVIASLSFVASAAPMKLCPDEVKFGALPVSQVLTLAGIPGRWKLDVPVAAKLQGITETELLAKVPADISVTIERDDRIVAEFDTSNGACGFLGGTLRVAAGGGGETLRFVVTRWRLGTDAFIYWRSEKGDNGMVAHLTPGRQPEFDILTIGGDHVRENPIAFQRVKE